MWLWPLLGVVDECHLYNEKLEKSFYDSVEDLISAKPLRHRVMELRHEASQYE